MTVASRPSGTFATIMPKGQLKNKILATKLTNEKDNSFEPMVAENKSEDEENYTEKDSNASDDVDKMFDFLIHSNIFGCNILVT